MGLKYTEHRSVLCSFVYMVSLQFCFHTDSWAHCLLVNLETMNTMPSFSFCHSKEKINPSSAKYNTLKCFSVSFWKPKLRKVSCSDLD